MTDPRQDDVVIVAAQRTAIGSFQGQFNQTSATDLGAAAIRGALDQAKLSPEQVDQVIMGCVLPAGLGQAPARQAMLAAGLPMGVGATTLNKVCGSGMQSIIFAHDMIKAGSAECVVAGGMESMTRAPYLVDRGLRMGHSKALDHMFFDGLQNPYDGQMMGQFAEQCASHHSFTRAAQDAFAQQSVERAVTAIESGAFAPEITPVTAKTRQGDISIDQDEEPGRCNIDKMPHLRPAFAKDGTVTAASSSKISDGAAALVVMSRARAEAMGLTPLARICAHAGHAQEPEWFTTAPVGAIGQVLTKAKWDSAGVDLYEINEAFAVVTMAAMAAHKLNADQVNVFGGALALGHPIGASGARVVVTLLNALTHRDKARGVAALCIGGGEATALAIERL